MPPNTPNYAQWENQKKGRKGEEKYFRREWQQNYRLDENQST